MTINHCMSHGITAMEFVKSLAETARGVPLTNPPFLDITILRSRHPPSINHPHIEFSEIDNESNIAALYEEDPMAYNSFLFDPEKLQRLTRMATEGRGGGGKIETCSTFTALTALVWRARTKALKMKPNQKTKLLFA